MDPDTYAKLYGPGRPASQRRGAGVALMAGVLWAVSLLLLGCLGFLAMWAEADRGPTEGMSLRWGLIGLAIAAVPSGLLCIPVVRRLAVPARMLATGLAICSIAVGLAIRMA